MKKIVFIVVLFTMIFGFERIGLCHKEAIHELMVKKAEVFLKQVYRDTDRR